MNARRAISFCFVALLLTALIVGCWTAFAVQPHAGAITNSSSNSTSSAETIANDTIASGPNDLGLPPARFESNLVRLTTSSSQSSQTPETLVYLSRLNYTQAAIDYGTSKGITTLAPQVYALDRSGNLVVADSSFNASLFVAIAHARGLKAVPLVAAGSYLCIDSNVPWCNDQGILSVAENSTQRALFTREIVSLCKSYNFDGIQLDWETTTLNTTIRPAMTGALNEIAIALHNLSPRRTLSLTTVLDNYQTGPYNVWYLTQGQIDQVNVQAYTNDPLLFQSTTNYILANSANASKVAVGLGDYGGVNPSSAGQDVEYLIQNKVEALAIWPRMGGEISYGAYNYLDSEYHTSNFYALLQVYLSKSG